MWKRQANSVTLAITTHRKVGEISDWMGTQVKLQMINKCKALVISRGLYKRRASPWRGDQKKSKERTEEREKDHSH